MNNDELLHCKERILFFLFKFMYLWWSLHMKLVRLDFHNCFRMFLTTVSLSFFYRTACGYFQRVTSVFFCIYLPHTPVSAWSPGFCWLNEMPVCVFPIRQAILSTAESFIAKHIGEPKGPAACIFCRNNDKIIYRPINFVTWASFFVVQHWHAWNLATEWFRVFFFWGGARFRRGLNFKQP